MNGNPGNYASGKLLLKGQQVYNNGIESVNRICDELYTVEGIGKARSINLDDINDLVGYTEPETKFYKITNSNYLYYPVRYIDDNGSAIDSDVVKTDGFSRSSSGVNTSNSYVKTWVASNKEITGYGLDIVKANTSLGVTDNSYSYNISDYTDDEVIKELILGSTGEDKGNYPQDPYWIASRVVNFGGSTALFTMAYCNPSGTNTITYETNTYTSSNYAAIIVNEDGTDNRETVKYNQKAYHLRPVIELDTSVTINTTITDTAKGTYEKPWLIEVNGEIEDMTKY